MRLSKISRPSASSSAWTLGAADRERLGLQRQFVLLAVVDENQAGFAG